MPCNIKIAFMKGDPFLKGSRELRLPNTKGPAPYPQLPPGESCVARNLRGVLGLANAPRMWFLRLCRALREQGWEQKP